MNKPYTILIMTIACLNLNLHAHSPQEKLRFNLSERQRTQKSVTKIRNISLGCAATSIAIFGAFLHFVPNRHYRTDSMSKFIGFAALGGLTYLNALWSIPTCIATTIYGLYNGIQIKELENELQQLNSNQI